MPQSIESSKIILIESEAFYVLCEHIVQRLKNEFKATEKWLGEKDAMNLLKIKSKATLQKLRDQREIVFTQPMKKLILYDMDSINDYLDRHSTKWISEKDALRMLGMKSKSDIQRLADQGKIESKQNGSSEFIYSVKSINNYLTNNK